MAARRMSCWECGTLFYGRADARYCCGSCRQKAYRKRSHRRGVLEAVPAPELSEVITQARQGRQQARAARKRAAAARRASVEARAKGRRNT
jgi:hypothetical protein